MADAQPTVVDPDRLRLARLERRLRQRDISAHLHVAPQRVSDFEQGLRHPTSEQTVILTQLLGRQILLRAQEVG
jgi:transcriptional regulator with XRE-family HTH domain